MDTLLAQFEKVTHSALALLPSLGFGLLTLALFVLLGRVGRSAVRRLVGRLGRDETAAILVGRLAQWLCVLLGVLYMTATSGGQGMLDQASGMAYGSRQEIFATTWRAIRDFWPIGSGLGMINPYSIRTIKSRLTVPTIVDAGVGTASDATLVMEQGVDGILMNTALAEAKEPVAMAWAMRWGVMAGRAAYLAGRMPTREVAVPSSPTRGMLG